MIARELETECKRCNGTGKTAVKGQRIALICSCAAGRMIAGHVFMMTRDPRTGTWSVL